MTHAANDGLDPNMTFDIDEIRSESTIGLCVRIGDDILWIPKKECQWTPSTIIMRRSIAKKHFVI